MSEPLMVINYFVIANELIHFAKMRNLQLLFKVDFEKAFDSVNGNFFLV